MSHTHSRTPAGRLRGAVFFFLLAQGCASRSGADSDASCGQSGGDDTGAEVSGADDTAVDDTAADDTAVDDTAADDTAADDTAGVPEDVPLSDADATLSGTMPYSYTGQSVAGVGDVDGDGVGDLLVGAHGERTAGTDAGAAYLVGGSVRGERSLTEADATLIAEARGDSAGEAVAGPGDVNGDGYADLLVSASHSGRAGDGFGAIYLVSGPVSGELGLGDADATILGFEEYHFAELALSGAGDVNADGLADFIVGLPGQGDWNHGAACVFLGPIDDDLGVDDAAACLIGSSGNTSAGDAVASAGDVNGDGFDDVLVGAAGANGAVSDVGAAWLFFGPISAGWDIASADAIVQGEALGDELGAALAGAGDVDADGLDDLLIGAPGVRNDDGSVGMAMVFLGPVTGTVRRTQADTTLYGELHNLRVGDRVAGAGDIDGDDHDDLMVSARLDGTGTTGVVYLLLGAPTGTVSLSADHADRRLIVDEPEFGCLHDVAGIGDVDGDGLDDLLVGAPADNSVGRFTGAAYLFLGW